MTLPDEIITGRVFNRLTVIGRDLSRTGTYWLCECTCGSTTTVQDSHLRAGRTKSCGCLRRENTIKRNQKTVVNYGSAHDRVRRERGKASDYPCAHCGNQGADWAYDHGDPGELTEDRGGYILAYSLDSSRYMSLCKPCHAEFDAPEFCKSGRHRLSETRDARWRPHCGECRREYGRAYQAKKRAERKATAA